MNMFEAFMGGKPFVAPPGQVILRLSSQEWTVPAGVTQISVVCVGSGQGAGYVSGGEPGMTYLSRNISGENPLCSAGCGGGYPTNVATLSVGTGGNGGGGWNAVVGTGSIMRNGGGAGGYSGNGGDADRNTSNNGGDGQGGGGGGASRLPNVTNPNSAGGGVGLLGIGPNGLGGIGGASSDTGGRGGSNGDNGVSGSSNTMNIGSTRYGGGYPGCPGGDLRYVNNIAVVPLETLYAAVLNGIDGGGAIRIMWGDTRTFPNNAGDV